MRAKNSRSTIYFLFWTTKNFLYSLWTSENLHLRNYDDIWHTIRLSDMQKYVFWRNKWSYCGLVDHSPYGFWFHNPQTPPKVRIKRWNAQISDVEMISDHLMSDQNPNDIISLKAIWILGEKMMKNHRFLKNYWIFFSTIRHKHALVYRLCVCGRWDYYAM